MIGLYALEEMSLCFTWRPKYAERLDFWPQQIRDCGTVTCFL